MYPLVKNGSGLVVWICGLAGSGKSTIGKALCGALKQRISHIVYLDGDVLRDLLGNYGYDKQGRIEIALQYSKFAHFLSNQGLVVVVATISMFDEIYTYNKKTLENYCEVYIQCDLEELKRRDQKGLYSGALEGRISNVVGVDIAFDMPRADVVIDNGKQDGLEAKVQKLLELFLES